VHHQVREWVTLLEVARERQQTIQHLRAHQFAAAHEVLQNILRYLDQLPQTLEVLKERRKTLDLLQDLESYRYEKVIKKSVGFITARRRGL
jgi:tryptophan 2,3-dioxygenase